MQTLLSIVDFSLLEQGYQIGLDWLGSFVRVIIESVGIIGVGIICFTLILKAITLPFDIYQRVTMRKQTLAMREMKPELEKLQKQYANDKATYNAKFMELSKKNGYNLLGACLPMIISLVILIVAFQAFRAYSQYANLNFFVQMSEDYNAAVLVSGEEGIDYMLQKQTTTAEDGSVSETIVVDQDGNYTLLWTENGEARSQAWNGGAFTKDGCEYSLLELDGTPYMQVVPEDETKYVLYRYSLAASSVSKEYQVDSERLANALPDGDETKIRLQNAADRDEVAAICREYIVSIGAKAAMAWYELPENNPGFLWIKNVWYPDVSYDHPIPDYKGFTDQFGNVEVQFEDGSRRTLQNVLTEQNYNDLTSQLTEEKQEANGYFILIILSIGLMVGSQLITMKSSKETNQYQTVDGSGARTQKIMLVVMPLIYAMFAFFYSAAFSIYMVMSSVFSIVVTLISNLVIGRIFRKKEEAKIIEQNTRILPWMQKENGKQAKKNGKSRKK